MGPGVSKTGRGVKNPSVDLNEHNISTTINKTDSISTHI
jgi:hypothetical protein